MTKKEKFEAIQKVRELLLNLEMERQTVEMALPVFLPEYIKKTPLITGIYTALRELEEWENEE